MGCSSPMLAENANGHLELRRDNNEAHEGVGGSNA